jgi:hypothetical protein
MCQAEQQRTGRTAFHHELFWQEHCVLEIPPQLSGALLSLQLSVPQVSIVFDAFPAE